MATDLMPTLPGMPDDAAPNAYDEAQLRAEEARRIFEALNAGEEWMQDYFDLVAEGWSWRQALYIIWAAQPKPRTPATQAELATEYLGLSSDRAIRVWRKNNPALDLRIRQMTISALSKHTADILEALRKSAQNDSYRHHQDRKMALEILGIYQQRSGLDVSVREPEDLARASDDELAALAQIPTDDIDEDEDDDD